MRFLSKLLSAMVVASALASPAIAQEKDTSVHPRVPGPQFVLPDNAEQKCVHDADPTKTGKCDRDTAFMRRNHMELLKHKRDITMYKGVRTKDNSLQNCINCHVTKDDAGKAIKVSSSKHFCASCHEYVAVKLDCFECHRSTPDKSATSASIPNIRAHGSLLANGDSETKALGAFLKNFATQNTSSSSGLTRGSRATGSEFVALDYRVKPGNDEKSETGAFFKGVAE